MERRVTKGIETGILISTGMKKREPWSRSQSTCLGPLDGQGGPPGTPPQPQPAGCCCDARRCRSSPLRSWANEITRWCPCVICRVIGKQLVQ